MNQSASRPIRSAVVAGMAVAVPVILCWAHWRLFGIWHPYSLVVAAGVIAAVILVKNDRLRSMNTRELLAPLLEVGNRRTGAVVVFVGLEVVALAIGGTRLFQRHTLLGKIRGVDLCLAETTDPKAAEELDLGAERDESVVLCHSRREAEAKRAAAKSCIDLVASVSRSDASAITSATNLAEPEKSVLLRAVRGSLTAADLAVPKTAFSSCDGRFWPVYVKGMASAAKAWGDVSSDAVVADDLRKELGGGGQKMSVEAAAALSANAEAKAAKVPTTGRSDAGVDTFCLFAEHVTHTARGPACVAVGKRVKRAEAIEDAKTKADEAKEQAKQKADEAREQARAAATQRCMNGCERVDPDMGERWSKCTDRCTGLDKLDAPLPF